MKQTYTYFIDLATSADKVQNISVSAGGEEAVRRLMPFFMAYKYFKLGPVTVKFVPASTLPVDPTGLSYTAGENTVDPRDQFNPGLIRITNGEDIVPPANMDGYYALMLDRRWYKFQLQSGARRTCYPRLWSVANLHQNIFPDEWKNYPKHSDLKVYNENTIINDSDPVGATRSYEAGSDPRGLFQTGNNVRLDWLPTDASNAWDPNITNSYQTVNVPPEVPVLDIILPQAYKTVYYYRVFVTETVYFKDPVALATHAVSVQNNYLTVNGVDKFIYPQLAFGPRTVPRTAFPYQNDGSDFRTDTKA
ncbi:capsid protein [Chicken associated huchismacovirus 1]|uniref:Capsid protein n=1 Tax=Chicken associated huchismacovirus 1 TaxID=2169932 RepID=A0A1L6KWC4_9VIRU|nr:capsid protein [Chicken associated huchismacovirus 1]APR73548.1 capsid protein [Chicken associated huchismacovirus 1]AXL64547.1 capsid protein [Chicken associated smacovirus]